MPAEDSSLLTVGGWLMFPMNLVEMKSTFVNTGTSKPCADLSSRWN